MSTDGKAPSLVAQARGPKDHMAGGSDATVARARVNRERARWHITLGTIRAHLDEQPSRAARRTAARRWCAAITAMAEEGAR